MDEKDKEIQKIREYNYLLWAVIVIFGLMIVDLFAQQTCTDKLFVDKVSFASTISSIILSVIAIIMTVVSNDSINSLLHKFRDLSEELRDVPKKFNDVATSLQTSSSKLEKMNDAVSNLPDDIVKTNEQIEKLSTMLNKAISTINSIEQNTLEVTRKLKTTEFSMLKKSDDDYQQLISKNDLHLFTSNLPSGPIHVIEIFIKAFQKKKILDLKKIGKKIFGTSDYIIGILAICRALGLIELDILKYREQVVVVKNIDENFIKEIEDTIDNFNREDDYIDEDLLNLIDDLVSNSENASRYK